ncbi:PAS domain S-box protein [Methylocapsa palsarum]|uniref:Blue-light-activated histidine kinase n=1 Tax=Methylocapsa palsarum TaxID=1612308 RepID=A0A1I4A723_9HYPH|nr:PAS domain S-box protein [Methylocapsa palsarum]SFK52000.1 PAS domain S-box-containing protein [Methylocapsa palsarum]
MNQTPFWEAAPPPAAPAPAARKRLEALWARFSDAPASGRYAAGVAAAVAAILLRVSLTPLWGDHFPDLFFFPATLFTALLVGLGPGLACVGLYAFLAAIFVSPIESSADIAGLAGSVAVNCLIAWLSAAHRAALLEARTQKAELRLATRLARENEDKFRILLDGLADHAVSLLDAQGRVVNWHDAGRRVPGWAPKDLIGQHVCAFYPADQRELGRPDADLETAARLGVFRGESQRVDHDGSLILTEVVITALFDEAGSLRGFVKIDRDVTERKKIEAARSEKALLQAVLQSSPNIIFAQDRQGRVTVANAAYFDFFGRKPEQVIGFSVSAFVPDEETVRQIREMDDRIMTTGETARFDWSHGPEGAERAYSVALAPVRAADGSIDGLVGVFTDITEHKTTETALRASEERLLHTSQRLNAILEAAPVGIGFSEDVTCQKIKGNRALLAQFEASAADNVSASAADALAQGRKIRYWREGRELSAEALPLQRAVAENALIPAMEFEVELPSGKRWFCEGRGAPVLDDAGRVIGGIAVTVDVTERKRYDERVKVLLGEVNHRAKNLLAVVQAIARLTMRGTDSNLFVQQFEERIAGLAVCQDLLVANDWTGVDLSNLVRTQLAHYLGPQIVIAGAPTRVNVVAAQTLGMSLHELGTNAVKYGALSVPAGVVRVEWSVFGGEGEPPVFRLTWSEHHGPPPTPPAHRGFGHKVLLQMAQRALDAEIALDFPQSGLVWELTARADRIIEPDASQ